MSNLNSGVVFRNKKMIKYSISYVNYVCTELKSITNNCLKEEK